MGSAYSLCLKSISGSAVSGSEVCPPTYREERILFTNLQGEEETCLPPRGILFTIDYRTGGKNLHIL